MFKDGQRVKVVKNDFSYMPGYVGKRGKVVPGVSNTGKSCRVKLVNGPELWFSYSELEKE